jgi:hypothetical protein
MGTLYLSFSLPVFIEGGAKKLASSGMRHACRIAIESWDRQVVVVGLKHALQHVVAIPCKQQIDQKSQWEHSDLLELKSVGSDDCC